MNARSRLGQNGFAIVATLVMMILLVVVAVGLLTLSTISLRASSHGEGRSRAQANAKLALMMALGDLQAYAGPDTRITATGSIIDSPDKSKEHVTGVWESWKIDPKNPPGATEYEKTGGKQQKFKKWLVSSPDPATTESLDFVKSQPPSEDKRITLVPGFTSGADAISPVYGGLVPVAGKSNQAGSFAYAVLDEGVKARLDTGFKPVEETKLADLAATLGGGSRPDVARIPGLEKIDWTAADVSQSGYQLDKVLSFPAVSLLLDKLGDQGGTDYQSLLHDVSVSSLGVFSDTANGGLKQDLNSILNAPALPADFAGTVNSKMYSTHLGIPVTSSSSIGQIEPSWQQLFRLAGMHSKLTNKSGPTLAMQPPTSWISSLQPPPATNYQNISMMPSVVKVQMYYSILAVPLAMNGSLTTKPQTNAQWTDSEAGLVSWASTAWDKGARYFMMICMSPVVTLHNPYNTNLEVSNLSVEMTNVPISIQLERKMASGASSGWLPAKGQGADNIDTESKERPKTGGRKYIFDLTNGPNISTFTMAPGEVRMFSPTAPPNTSYVGNEYRSWNNFTDPLAAQPMKLDKGFRGVTIGFYAPRITANEMQGYETYPNPGESKRNSLEYLGPNDQIRAKIRPCLDARIASSTVEKGKCKVALVRTGSNGTVNYSVTTLNVGTAGTSGNLLTGLEKSLNLPDTGQDTAWVGAREIAIASGSAPLNGLQAYTFGLATISAKTTFGNFEDKKYDGAMAAKPMAFHSPAATYTVVDLAKNGLEPSAYEAGVIPLDSSQGTGFEEYVEVNAYGRSYAISGLRSSRGQQFGTIYEVPMGPLRNFSQLNSANPAGTNSLARFTYPIGNSWAHPMIPPDAVSGANNSFDHSFLLNSLFYDKYYCSGIAARQNSAFLTGANVDELGANFLRNSTEGATLDKRLIPFLPDGESEEDGIEALSKANDTDPDQPQARFQAASHQMMKGAFNVNSTSKHAWKAMLASLHAPDAMMFLANQSSPAATISKLKSPDVGHARFSRFAVPNSEAPGDSSDHQQVFQGPRDIDDGQLDLLAAEIVREVRARGPFLSMAEFVNRQLGNSDLAQKGALQSAIDATPINGNNSILENTGYQLASPSSKYLNPKAMEGRSDQGAPGYLTQADLLNVLGSAATVRSDTFTVRSYGDARDSAGKIIARSWCEAVVQRLPEYVSAEDKSHVSPANLVSQSNRTFGRKFAIVSFRWLSPAEVNLTTSGI